jgi:hypothetical protein
VIILGGGGLVTEVPFVLPPAVIECGKQQHTAMLAKCAAAAGKSRAARSRAQEKAARDGLAAFISHASCTGLLIDFPAAIIAGVSADDLPAAALPANIAPRGIVNATGVQCFFNALLQALPPDFLVSLAESPPEFSLQPFFSQLRARSAAAALAGVSSISLPGPLTAEGRPLEEELHRVGASFRAQSDPGSVLDMLLELAPPQCSSTCGLWGMFRNTCSCGALLRRDPQHSLDILRFNLQDGLSAACGVTPSLDPDWKGHNVDGGGTCLSFTYFQGSILLPQPVLPLNMTSLRKKNNGKDLTEAVWQEKVVVPVHLLPCDVVSLPHALQHLLLQPQGVDGPSFLLVTFFWLSSLVHIGRFLDRGHWVAYSRRTLTSPVYLCDDSSVSPSSIMHARQHFGLDERQRATATTCLFFYSMGPTDLDREIMNFLRREERLNVLVPLGGAMTANRRRKMYPLL